MSQVKITGNASGTGVLTIAAPNTNTDRTLSLPDSAGTVATAESTLSQFNASGSAPVYACRAWVNFNGTGTVAIRASGNVSSITDNGTGDYTVNFTTAMSDDDYAVCASSISSTSNTRGGTHIGAKGATTVNDAVTSYATSSIRICSAMGSTTTADGSELDVDVASIAIFR